MPRADQRRRGPQRRGAEADNEVLDFFLERIPRPPEFHFVDPKQLWRQVADIVLEQWIRASPGTRPLAWWKYDAPRWTEAELPPHYRERLPEPRRRLGGTGTPWHEEHPAALPKLSRGIPDAWAAIDPDDPPTYESEAAYLDRHGLLGPAERAVVVRLGLLEEVVAVLPEMPDQGGN